MRTIIETAVEADGPELLSAIESGQSDGVFKMIATRRPNPVLSYLQENSRTRIGMIRDRQQRIAAQFCVSPGEYYVNGSPCSVGYVGGVRKSPDFNGILDWKAMAAYVKDIGCELYTCSFLGESEIFTKKRKHFPQLFPLTGYTTYMINPKAVPYKKTDGFSFRVMTGQDRSRALAFVNREGSRYQFAPAVSSFSQFYGLKESDCYLMEKDGEIKAFGALWNQSSYKQYIVTEYKSYMKWMEKLSWLFQMLGYIPMPKKNTVLDFPSLSFFYAEAGDKDLYENFLARIGEEVVKQYPMFLIGMAHKHPNRPSIQKMKSIHFDSMLYYVRYDNDLVPEEERPVHCECALL